MSAATAVGKGAVKVGKKILSRKTDKGTTIGQELAVKGSTAIGKSVTNLASGATKKAQKLKATASTNGNGAEIKKPGIVERTLAAKGLTKEQSTAMGAAAIKSALKTETYSGSSRTKSISGNGFVDVVKKRWWIILLVVLPVGVIIFLLLRKRK